MKKNDNGLGWFGYVDWGGVMGRASGAKERRA